MTNNSQATHFIEQYNTVDGHIKHEFQTGVIPIKNLENTLLLTSKQPSLKTVAIFKIKYK